MSRCDTLRSHKEDTCRMYLLWFGQNLPFPQYFDKNRKKQADRRLPDR